MAIKFSRLSRPAIRALAIGGKLAEHGITAERQANGDVRYTVNIMVDSQRIHRVVGRESEGVTREQAERAIETFRTKAREGRLDLPTGRKAHQLFSEAADEYIKRLEESGGKNVKIKTRQFRMYLKPELGRERLDKLSEFGLKKYRKKRTGDGASEATVNRELATLSHFLRSAADWKWIKRDDVPVIPKAAERRKTITILTDEQSEALMQGAIGDQDGRVWLFVAFGLNAAMRHREILSVRYDQIDFTNRRIFIPEAKAGEREQPITAALADALMRQRTMEADPDGWVFPTLNAKQAKGGHRTNMARPFLRSVIRAQLDPDKVTPHTMRHTAITRLVKAGVDLPTIQRISGHKTLAMVLRYTHVHGTHIDAAIDALSRPIPNAVTQKLHTPLEGKAGKGDKIVELKRRKSAA
ncbi:site-specific recombinase XerD [Sphingomonas sp. PP-CE-3G-477]|uniref:tyrosine-type recombinase/integrase n=1 Tax=Sphingomonas sp. PP-CE-3G-477 TaxID=2135660 RepID=UPI000D39AB80|nr:site-specific integrase [Sphingomonas sp. PP-CE-3G-477]PTQ64466.1 site-specific recombinase XerD [Sphingomonas sp. PP-CE-3G-477]